MTHFTTSKGEFIAVPVPKGTSIRHIPFNNYEIIGLSSDILKDEELAKKVIEEVQYTESKGVSIWYPLYGSDKVQIGDKLLWNEMCEYSNLSFASLMGLHNITGNQLIIKKHGTNN